MNVGERNIIIKVHKMLHDEKTTKQDIDNELDKLFDPVKRY